MRDDFALFGKIIMDTQIIPCVIFSMWLYMRLYRLHLTPPWKHHASGDGKQARSAAGSSDEEPEHQAMTRSPSYIKLCVAIHSTRHDMRQVRKLKKLAQLRKGLQLPGSELRVPKSTAVDEDTQQEMNRTSREEMLSKLLAKEKELKESLSFAGRKTGELTDSGWGRNISIPAQITIKKLKIVNVFFARYDTTMHVTPSKLNWRRPSLCAVAKFKCPRLKVNSFHPVNHQKLSNVLS